MMLAVADQIAAAHVFQRLAQQWPVFRVVIAQEGFVQAALFDAFGDRDVGDRTADFMQGVLA